MAPSSLQGSRSKLLNLTTPTLLWQLWAWWYKNIYRKSYQGESRAIETALLSSLLSRFDAYQIGYAIIQHVHSWADPSIRSVAGWLSEDLQDEVFHDKLLAKAYYLLYVTKDRELRDTIIRYDEIDAAYSWGHPANLTGARATLADMCDELCQI